MVDWPNGVLCGWVWEGVFFGGEQKTTRNGERVWVGVGFPKAHEKLKQPLGFFEHEAGKNELCGELRKTWMLATGTKVSGKLIYNLVTCSDAKELRKACLSQLGICDKYALSLMPAKGQGWR